jgi:hypothetical protein
VTACQTVRLDGWRVAAGCCWHCCLRQLREWPCGMPIKSRLVRRSKQARQISRLGYAIMSCHAISTTPVLSTINELTTRIHCRMQSGLAEEDNTSSTTIIHMKHSGPAARRTDEPHPNDRRIWVHRESRIVISKHSHEFVVYVSVSSASVSSLSLPCPQVSCKNVQVFVQGTIRVQDSRFLHYQEAYS